MSLDLDSLVLGWGSHTTHSDEVNVVEAAHVEHVLRTAPWAPRGSVPLVTALRLMGEHGVRLEEDFDEVSERLVRFFHVRNDSMASEPRQRLKRFVPRLPGTADDPDVERRRDYLCIDWVHRIATPAWLRLAGMKEEAGGLERQPDVTNRVTAHLAARAVHKAIRSACYRSSRLREADCQGWAFAIRELVETGRLDEASWAAAWSAGQTLLEEPDEGIVAVSETLERAALELADQLLALGGA